jgi:N-acetylglucosaminyl-diphospho-decaprenol L-rhamnosyltransferase
MKPTLSIVIVDSDSAADTLQCLDSIFRFPPDAPFEVILVDNCSKVSCLPAVRASYPHVRTFSAPERQGFAKNYNLGIRQSHGQYVLVLNNDTIIHPQALSRLLCAARENPSYGMLGPKLLSTNGKPQTVCARSLQHPYSYLWINLFIDAGLPLGKFWDRYRRWRLARRRSGPVPCISGACMLLPRGTLDRIGLLDEGYDFYYEDIEWCHRVQIYGQAVAYIAEAEITHLGDQSLSKVKVWAKQSEYRSALRYFGQYYGLTGRQAGMIWLVTVMNFFLRGLIFLFAEAIDGKSAHARAYFYLWSWVLDRKPTSDFI